MKRSNLVLVDNLFFPFFWVAKMMKSILPSSNTHNDHIVILKFFGVGSITRIAAVLKDANPQKEVTFLTLKRNQSVVELLDLKAIYMNDANPFVLLLSGFQRVFTIWKLKKTEVVDMERSSNIAGVYSMILSIRKKHARFLLEGQSSETKNTRLVSLKQKTATDGISEILGMTPMSSEKVLVQTANVRKIMININAGGYLPERKYPINQWVDLVKGLSERFPNANFYLSGLESEKDYVTSFSMELARFLPESSCTILAGTQNLEAFIASLKESDLFLTNDSGPLHLAHYFDVKTVAIWGPTSSYLVGYPNSPKMLNLSHELPCSPCFISPKSKVAKACGGELTCFQKMNTPEMLEEINVFVGKIDQ